MARTQRLAFSFAGALSFAGAAFALPAPVLACSPDPCPEPVRTFGENAHVPGNLVRFRILPGVDPSALNLELRTAAGELIPASVQGSDSERYFAPDQTMAPDLDLVLSYTRACNQWAEEPGEMPVEYAFSTFESETPELLDPELVLIEQGQLFLGPDFPDHVFKRFRIYSGVNPSVAGHMLQLSATVDGTRFHIDSSGYEPLLTLAANCEQTEPVSVDSCGTGGWLAPGMHTVELRSSVVGEAPRPVVTLDVELSCDELAGTDPDPDPVGGASGSGDSTEEDAPVAAQSGGCSAAPRSDSASWSGLGLAIGALTLLARRKRRGRAKLAGHAQPSNVSRR
jgi:hypothetical protein